MLCKKALQNYEKYSIFTHPSAGNRLNQQRGLLINYDSLPGYTAHVMLPFFGIDPLPERWLAKMEQESDFYSKGRGVLSKRVFEGDSEDKDTRATDSINKYADELLSESFQLLNQKSVEGMRQAFPDVFSKLFPSGQVDWTAIKEIPTAASAAAAGSLRGGGAGQRQLGRGGLIKTDGDLGHSAILKQKEFVPWAPFTNHHSSKTIEVLIIVCEYVLQTVAIFQLRFLSMLRM